jgi:IS30 family transposase
MSNLYYLLLFPAYKTAVLTITADNGKELSYHEEMAVSLGATVYFSDPYSSWQLGLNGIRMDHYESMGQLR